MTFAEVKDILAAFQSVATVVSFAVAGWWVYSRYIHEQGGYPKINFSADIKLIGKQGDKWVVEVIAAIENSGRAQLKLNECFFFLDFLKADDALEKCERWSNQLCFKEDIRKQSFFHKGVKFYFVDPGTTAKYSHVTIVDVDVTFLLLHCYFKYSDDRHYFHGAEKTINLNVEAKKASITA